MAIIKNVMSRVLKPGFTLFKSCTKVAFSQKYLVYTNTGISVCLSMTGDVLQQSYQQRHSSGYSWNTKRSMHMATAGLVCGPVFHYWYFFLDKFLPGRTLRVVVKKLLADQLICSPMYILMFLMTTCSLENKSFSEFKSEFKEKAVSLYMAEWVIWTPAQTINFFFVPPHFRVLYENSVCLLADCYYSYVKYEY